MDKVYCMAFFLFHFHFEENVAEALSVGTWRGKMKKKAILLANDKNIFIILELFKVQ